MKPIKTPQLERIATKKGTAATKRWPPHQEPLTTFWYGSPRLKSTHLPAGLSN